MRRGAKLVEPLGSSGGYRPRSARLARFATPCWATRMIGTTMRNPSIVRQTRWNPVGLIMIAILVLPFALTGKTNGLVLAGVVWVVVAFLLLRWWRTQKRSQAAESFRLIRMACSLSAWRRCFTFWWRCRRRCCCSSPPGACAPRRGGA